MGGNYIKNIALNFENNCAGCSHMHGIRHEVSCDQRQLIYTSDDNFRLPKIYHLDKAYSNPYQWPFPGIPYKDWLKAKDCEFFNSSEDGEYC